MSFITAIHDALRVQFERRREPHSVPRFHAATKAESKLARRKAIDRQLELAVAVCHLTPEQRSAAKLRAANSRSMENGRGRG